MDAGLENFTWHLRPFKDVPIVSVPPYRALKFTRHVMHESAC